MKKISSGLLMCLCFLSAALAQDGEESTSAVYEALELHHCDSLEANMDGTLHRLSGSVKLSLLAQAPEDNLRIEAEEVGFGYDEDDPQSPARMELDGKVTIVTRDGEVRAEHATIDLETKEALFTGNPSADMPGIEGAKFEYIQMNLDTGEIVAGRGSVRRIRLQPEDESDSAADQDPDADR